MQLENLAYEARNLQAQRQQVYFVVGDLESLSASALYTKDEPFKFTKKGLVIPIPGVDIPGFHDTYKVDKDGNFSDGHSTINIQGGGKVYMPHGLGKPTIRRGS